MDYRQAVDYVLSRSNLEASGSQLRYREFHLERVRHFLSLLGNPDRAVSVVHVAGTKGKGSTVAMVASILSAAGYRTGRYTSPHLHTIRERLAIDGVPISEAAFAAGITTLLPVIEESDRTGSYGRVTTFEILTALAFVYFKESGCSFAVIEVGLGGRLDATNVISPEAVAITNLSLDHTEILGNTVAAIAAEKAAIIKPGVPVVSAPQPPEALQVVRARAETCSAPLTLAGHTVTWSAHPGTHSFQRLSIRTATTTYSAALPLLGEFQLENAAVAVGLCEALRERGHAISKQAIERGLASVSWPGRLEVLNDGTPLLVADGAHNPYSIRRLVQAVQATFSYQHALVVFGATRTKDLSGMLLELAGLSSARLLAVQSRHPRALTALQLAAAARQQALQAEPSGSVAAGLARARALAGSRDLILVTGSLFVVAEAREATLGIPAEIYPTFTGAMV